MHSIHTLRLAALGLAAAIVLGVPADSARAQNQQPIYGSQLMTDQERAEYRSRMRAATSAEERAEIRAEHHEEMQERAAGMGVTLPEEPPARGMGQGRGQGMGMGPGPRQGQGLGPGRGQGMMGQPQGQGTGQGQQTNQPGGGSDG